jgi:hypothetical protein
MSLVESRLGQAVITALQRCSKGEVEGWVARADLDAELLNDEWILRNQHRLSRLDSTIAGLAREGYLEIDGQRLRLLLR